MAAGFAAGGFGPRVTIFAGAAACLIAAGVFAWRLPSIRPVARQLVRERQAVDGIPVAEMLDPVPASR